MENPLSVLKGEGISKEEVEDRTGLEMIGDQYALASILSSRSSSLEEGMNGGAV